MTDRKITGSRKGYDGDILALCNPGKTWSPRFKNDVIRDIENNINSYFVEVNGKRIGVNIILKRGSKHLISDKQKTLNNILDDLAAC